MTSINANKCVGDFETIFKENIRSLKDCHIILAEYASEDNEIAELLVNLKSIGNLYKEEFVEYHKYQSAINATAEHFNQGDNIDDSFEALFKDKLKHQKGIESSADAIVDGILGFTKINADPDENGNDESIICTQSSTNIIDPITKMQIVTPFRNKICSHVYEKESILSYVKRKKNKAKCPYVGCTNSDMRAEVLELDFTLSQRINQGAFASTPLHQSVTAIDETSSEEDMNVDDY